MKVTKEYKVVTNKNPWHVKNDIEYLMVNNEGKLVALVNLTGGEYRYLTWREKVRLLTGI